MDTIEDAINELFRIYYDVSKQNMKIYDKITYQDIRDMFLKEKADYLNEDEIDEDTMPYEDEEEYYTSQYFTSVKEDILDFFSDLRDEDYDLYSDFVSLLLIEYYNLSLINKEDEEYFEDDDEILFSINDMTKKEFLECTEYDDNDFLEEIIESIIIEYEPELDEAIEYDYLYIERFLNDKDFQKVYKKFHPNLKIELIEINKYLCNSKLLEQVYNIKINDLFDYIYLSLITKANVEKKLYYHDILISKLSQIRLENEKLYNDIIVYLTQFLYIYIKDKEEKTDIDIESLKTIEEEPKAGIVYVTDEDYLIDCFYDYNILKHNTSIDNLSEDTKKKMKKFIQN